jgi:L-ascorbate metabolism protein UlaG (beta-lactamase superfamily)
MTPPHSDHFNGKTFFHPRTDGTGGLRALLKWKFSSRPAAWPRAVKFSTPPPPPAPRGDEIVTTWIGHSTFLLQTTRGNFLTDPVFSERASPVPWAGPRRTHAPGLAFDALPHIDAVLLSHDHYDHCDAPSLLRLAAAHNPLFVAPLRHHDLLSASGAKKITELDWWQSHAFAPDIAITLTPSQHWSNRLGTPRNHRLWGGFYLTLGTGPQAKRVWFAGDTGYDAETFRAIGERLGAPDLALIPIGAYEPRWFMEPMHMNPAESVATHREVGSKRSVAMHWGTFQLTDEARDAPLAALAAARVAAGLTEDEFRVLEPGASFVT